MADINLQEIVNQIHAVRQAQLGPVEKALSNANKFLSELDALAGKFNEADGRNIPAEVKTEMKEFPLEQLKTDAKNAQKKLEDARKRLSRKGITIGVAGSARQGKSTLLKSLSGLDDMTIPARGEGFCTAARSVITNSDQQKAEISFHSQESFFQETILPYYSDLNLSPQPRSLDDFLNNPLPEKPGGVEKDTLWNTLQEIHANAMGVIGRMTGSIQTINMEDVGSFVTKDKGSYDYLAVREAILSTPFPHAEIPKNIRLIDLPGMGEMALNIEKDLAKAASEEADIIIVIRKPAEDGQGDEWNDRDTKNNSIIEKAVPDSLLGDFMVTALNITGTNKATAERMKHSFSQRVSIKGGMEVIPLNCNDSGEVQKYLVGPVMDKLRTKVGGLDQSRINEAKKECKLFSSRVLNDLDTLRRTLTQLDDYGDDGIFGANIEAFMQQLKKCRRLTRAMKKNGTKAEITEKIHKEFSGIIQDLQKLADGDENAEISGYSRVSVDTIKSLLEGSEGAEGPINDSASMTRVSLSNMLANRLDPLFKDVVHELKMELQKELMGVEIFNRWVQVRGIDRESVIFGTLKDLISEKYSILKKAFTRIAEFDITYYSQIHPKVRDCLYPFDPEDYRYDSNEGLKSDEWVKELKSKEWDEQATEIRKTIDGLACQIVYNISKNKAVVQFEINDILYHTAKDFLDQIMWASEAEEEWRYLLGEQKRQMFADQYAASNDAARFAQGLMNTVSSLQTAAAQVSL